MVLIDMSVENKKEKINTGEILKNQFKNNWEEEFLFDGINDNVLSYQDFFSLILRYKEKLQELGLKKNDIVCLLLHNSVDLVVLYFALLVMQLVVVPIDLNKGKNEIKEILSQINYKVVISDISNLEFVSRKIDYKYFSDIRYSKSYVDFNELDIFTDLDYDRLFLITFTSGTTGIPKGVMHSFNNLVLSAVAFNRKFNFDKENVFYHNLSMSYMAGILNLIILPFISGSKIVLGERFNISNIARFWDIPAKYSVNTFWFIPTILELLLKLDRGTKGIDHLSKNKIIGCVGTAPLNKQTKVAIQKKYSIQLFQSYGLSETLFVTTNYPGHDVENSTGVILDGVKLDFCNDKEITIDVPWMFLGYVNLDKEQYFKNGKYLSGDIGEVDKNSFLLITGRKKDLIIKGGMNISPRKIENFISELNVFEESIVLGFEDRYLGEKVVCFFVPKEQTALEEKKRKLNLQVVDRLGRDYHIDEFVEMKSIPKNPNGKIDKPKIRETYNMRTNAHRD